MKKYLILFAVIFAACQPVAQDNGGWQKVYRNDERGGTTFGSKKALIDAVRLGYPVRIGWGGNRVEHVAEADFLTILQGDEVFAQIRSIVGQAPSIANDSLKIRFRMNNQWTKISGTNGYATAFMTNYLDDTIVGGGIDRYAATTWYVLYPAREKMIDATPLWRADSPLWESSMQ